MNRETCTTLIGRALPSGLPSLLLAAIFFGSLPALAQTSGGAGGGGFGAGGAGGISASIGVGGAGGVRLGGAGGGGGGAGATGGTGGAGIGFGGNAAGGTGGESAGARGGMGGAGVNGGGGGGGGGAHGAIVTTSTTNAAAETGGSGGIGGNGSGPISGGGGGGAGGTGVVVNGSGLTYANSSGGRITGGTGGSPGLSTPDAAGGSEGGGGGAGVGFTASGTLVNSGSITGGNGGLANGGLGGGIGGAGGAGVDFTAGGTLVNSGSITGGNGGLGGGGGIGGGGIVGGGLTITNSGTITGGLGGGATRANAITFTGGTNSLVLQAGSTIIGNVVAFSGNDTLVLGGSANASFAISAQYQGFGLFSKIGSSTWMLTGTTAAVTPWTISAGTLEVSADAALGSDSGGLIFGGGTLQLAASFSTARAITLDAGGGTIDTDGNGAALSGTIGGVGGLTKAGTGTLTLSGANTYAGGTTVTGGTLLLTGAGTLGSTSGAATIAGGTLDLGGTVQTQNGGLTLAGGTLQNGTLFSSGTFGLQDGTVSAALAGTGAAEKTTAGTVILSGANTYSGGTTVTGGTLLLPGTGTLGSTSGAATITGGTLDLGGTVQTQNGGLTLAGGALQNGTFSSSWRFALQAGTVSAALAGTGATEKTGAGTVILSGANSYSGGTTVSAGTLLLTGGGTLGSTTGAVTVAGGVLDLGGTAQTQNGGLTLAGGTIRNGTFSSSGSFALEAGMVGAALAGTGAAEKTTAGTVILDGANSYTGGTTVSGGTLVVGDVNHPGASIAGNVVVGSGGTLMGHGTIGGNVANGGTVEPGGTIGLLTVGGNYTESHDSTLRIEITPNVAAGPGVGYDQLRIGGTASLAGALSIIDDPGTYSLGSRYTILTAAGGRSGAFSSVSTDPVFARYLSPQLTYDANSVYLALDPTPSPSGGPPALFNGGQEAPDALTALASTAAGVGDAVLGDGCATEVRHPETEQRPGCVVRTLGQGFHSEVWMRGIGGIGSLGGGGSRMSFHDDYAGFLIGAGVGSGGFTIGLGGGFAATALNFSDASFAAQDAGVGFVYGRYERGPLRLGVMGAYGGGAVNGTRALPGTDLAASGDRAGNFAVVQGRAGYDLAVGTVSLEPRATLAWLHAGQSGFSESGTGLFDLTYPDTHADEVAGKLTARVKDDFTAGSWSLEPWAEAGVQETFSGLSRSVVVTDGAFSSAVAGISPAPTAGVLGVGLGGAAGPGLDFFIRYQGLFAANQTASAFGAGLRARF